MVYSAELVQAIERTERTTIFRDEGEDADKPDYECQSYRDQMPAVKLVRDAYGGTRALREGKEEYLPKHPMESNQRYKDRVQIALAFEALRATIAGLVGMVFRRDPDTEEVAEAILPHLEDIDLRGNNLAVFGRKQAKESILDGHAWVHVEMQRVGEDVRTAQDADSRGLRPYWVRLTKSQVINWRYEIRDGRPIITMAAYREGALVPKGEFGEESVERIRVLREEAPGVVRGYLWELRKDENERERWDMIDQYDIGVTTVPLVPIFAEQTDDLESRPPLEDIAYEVIEHYRVRSERQKALTYSAISVPYHFGANALDPEGNPQVSWGSDGMLLSNDPDAKAGMIESEGNGLDALKEELQEIQARMAARGLQLIQRANQAQPSRDRTTATGQVLSRSEGDAWLATFAVEFEDGLAQCLALHAEYMGVPDAGRVQINRDFHDQLIDPALMRELREFHAADIIPIEDVWSALKRGEVLDETFDFDEARERLAMQREERLRAIEGQLLGRPGEVAA